MPTVVYEEFEYYEERRQPTPSILTPEQLRRALASICTRAAYTRDVFHRMEIDYVRLRKALHGQPQWVINTMIESGLIDRNHNIIPQYAPREWL